MYKIFCRNDSKYHSLNWKDVSVTNVDIFEKKQFSLQFLYSLLQVYIVHRVSIIFHVNVFLVSVCTRGFGYLLCWPRGRGIELVCTRRFSFHELCNFLLFNFLIFISFWKTCFFTHDNYPHPRTTTFSYTPFILKTMDSTWANQSKKRPGESGQAYCSYCSRDTLIRYGGTHLLFVEESTLASEFCICNKGNPFLRGNPAYVMKGIHQNRVKWPSITTILVYSLTKLDRCFMNSSCRLEREDKCPKPPR